MADRLINVVDRWRVNDEERQRYYDIITEQLSFLPMKGQIGPLCEKLGRVVIFFFAGALSVNNITRESS